MRCLKLVSQSQMPVCVGCFVATNAQSVTNTVLEAIDSPTLTPGTPVHLLASPAALISSQVNADKTFLDWWLLARSQTVVAFGYNYDSSGTGVLPAETMSFWSSYAVTATKFRDASSTLGRSIFIAATANLSTTRMRMRLCCQNRRGCAQPQ